MIRAFGIQRLSLLTIGALALLLAPKAYAMAARWFSDALMNAGGVLERRFPPTALDDGVPIAGFVVAGGSTSRTRELIRLSRRFPNSRIIISGASEREEAQIIAEGFEPSRLVLERDANTTFENAERAKRFARPAPGDRWILVTSALHMPRAIGSFRAAGFPVEAWPVFDAHPQPRYVAPVVMHELIGLVTYRLQGRSSELFPRPLLSLHDRPMDRAQVR